MIYRIVGFRQDGATHHFSDWLTSEIDAMRLMQSFVKTAGEQAGVFGIKDFVAFEVHPETDDTRYRIVRLNPDDSEDDLGTFNRLVSAETEINAATMSVKHIFGTRYKIVNVPITLPIFAERVNASAGA